MTEEPIKVDEKRCKSCAKCVRVCLTGVLSMKLDPHSISGMMISVDRPDYCIGCNKCEDVCPDMAIFVADKKDFPFLKPSQVPKEAKERQAKILENNCQTPEEETL